MIALGVVVRDKVTGFTGIAENRATFMYGCDRYCVQPKIDKDGKIPDSVMIDEPQLEWVDGEERVMSPVGTPDILVEMGQLVLDPIRNIEGTVVGRAVYLNGCSRIIIQPKKSGKKEIKSFWVDEKQVEPRNTFIGKKKITKEPDNDNRKSGGPATCSSKF
jgi:hypothetical protein